MRGADCVFAVAYRLPPSRDSPKLDIGGGTGLAVQMYVDRFEPRGSEPAAECRLYFYDDGAPGWDGCLKDPATHRKWNRWDALSEQWVALDAPPTLSTCGAAGQPPVSYAGIGGTRLDGEFGAKAISSLFEQMARV